MRRSFGIGLLVLCLIPRVTSATKFRGESEDSTNQRIRSNAGLMARLNDGKHYLVTWTIMLPLSEAPPKIFISSDGHTFVPMERGLFRLPDGEVVDTYVYDEAIPFGTHLPLRRRFAAGAAIPIEVIYGVGFAPTFQYYGNTNPATASRGGWYEANMEGIRFPQSMTGKR